MNSISSAWVAAMAAVAAAVIGPLVSLHLGRQQNKTARRQLSASVVSISRQAWIDKLRDAVAEFQSVLVNLGFRGGVVMELGVDEDKQFERAVYLRSRVALLVNPLEGDHQRLVILLDKALSVAHAVGPDRRRAMAETQAEITSLAQIILKREWVRVKAGEPDSPANSSVDVTTREP
jgi:hypothetical protein